MSTARPKRTRAQVNYVEPTELDDDIAVDDDAVEPVAAAEPADQSPDSDTSDGDSDSDEFTTDKSKLKAQQKALMKTKKVAKKSNKADKPKKIKNVPFPFMHLPPEIRVMVYNEALVESAKELTFVSKYQQRAFFRGHMEKKLNSRGHHYWSMKREKSNHEGRTPLQPVLLRVCKAIKDEALPFFYGQTFHFESPTVLLRFLSRISPANRMLLRDIVLRGWNGPGAWRSDLAPVFAVLSTATNIRRILFDRHVLNKTDSINGVWNPQSLWEDVEWWADAVDDAHGKGVANKVLQFTKLCFGSEDQIKNKDRALVKREQDFMRHLKFSVEPVDKPAQASTDAAATGNEATDASEK